MSGFQTAIQIADNLTTGHYWTFRIPTCPVFRWLLYHQTIITDNSITPEVEVWMVSTADQCLNPQILMHPKTEHLARFSNGLVFRGSFLALFVLKIQKFCPVFGQHSKTKHFKTALDVLCSNLFPRLFDWPVESQM